MAPKLIELKPDIVDFANDALKMSTLSIIGWLINSYVLNRPAPFQDTIQMLMITIAGLAVHHLITDTMIVRFVVKSGSEGMYAAMKRHG